jgi:hypothetical protein
MLPANLAKTRTAGRGTYGELVVLSGTPSGSLGAVGQTATLRYAPYPLPATITAGQQAAATSHHILPLSNSTPSIIQYASAGTPTLYDATVLHKRLLATTAVASLRQHHPAHNPARTATLNLNYPIGDLLGVQGLDIAGLYHIPATTIGL